MLVDTNVWSELCRPRPNERVVTWMGAHFSSCILSAIVLAEIRYGIALADDDARLQAFLNDLLTRLPRPIADFGAEAAATWGPLRAGLKRSGLLIAERDMLIAAHALALRVPLVTRNTSDMRRTGATIINPWDE